MPTSHSTESMPCPRCGSAEVERTPGTARCPSCNLSWIPEPRLDHLARTRGSLLAGAVGDALGNPLEFLSLSAIRAEHGPDGLTELPAPAQVTDDTQMTLFTAEGMIRASVRSDRGICDPPGVVYHAYLRWLTTQGEPLPASAHRDTILNGALVREPVLHARRAPGNTCLSALRSGKQGRRHERLNDSKGCGGLMRVAPVGLMAPILRNIFNVAAECAALTHGHPTGFLTAGYLAELVAQLVRGVPLLDAAEIARKRLAAEPEADESLRAVDAALELAHEEGEPSPEKVQSLGKGWIAEEALAISLYCALVAPSLKDALLLAVNHSGDSDSTGAITGNILGAALGPSSLPPGWAKRVDAYEVVDHLAHDLAREVESQPRDDEWLERYPGV